MLARKIFAEILGTALLVFIGAGMATLSFGFLDTGMTMQPTQWPASAGIVATALAFGMVPVVRPDFYDALPAWFQTIFHSGISSAAIMAVLLNIVFNELKLGNSVNPSVFAAKPVRFLTRDQLEGLEDGDAFVDGKLVDCDGEEIPVVPAEKVEEVRSLIAQGEVTTTQEIPAVVGAVLAESSPPSERAAATAEAASPSDPEGARPTGSRQGG